MDNTATMIPAEVTDAQVVEYLKTNDKKAQTLRTKFEGLFNNINFLKDETWMDQAINGLDKTDITERLESQLETGLRKKMRDDAINAAEQAGVQPILPTKDDIAKAVKKKMDERKAELNNKMEIKLANARAAIRAAATD